MRLTVTALALLIVTAPAPAHADEPLRFAVVIGANDGDAGDEPLVYAERDAEEVARTLREWGGVTDDRMQLLRGPDAGDVTAAIDATSAAIARAGTAETALLVYYSGHADATDMHLSGTRLSFADLRTRLEGSPAQVKVLIVDSCKSGEITRVKGADPADPFEISADDRLDTEGIAIITSSAADEDAQESERLRGGVFTHHLVTGLLGAADTSQDRRVTLTEAYVYAYEQTLRSTARARFVQHPTFAFEMKGKRDLVVTTLVATDRVGRLRFEDDGEFLVMTRANKRVVAELRVSGTTDLILDPGSYRIVWRSPNEVRELTVDVDSGRTVVIEVAAMTSVEAAETTDKGAPGETPARPADVAPLAIAVSLGSGMGRVSGQTEQTNNQVACCLAYEPYHLRADIAYRLDPRTELSFGARIGIPAGANIPGHAGYAPSFLARITRSLASIGRGWSLHAEAGGGIVRHTVKLADPPAQGDTDTVRTGPVLLGGGARWTKPIGGSFGLAVDITLLAAPGLFNPDENASYTLDLSLGLVADL